MTLARSAAALTTVLLAAAGITADYASAAAPARPAAGVWRILDGGGSFTVGPNQTSISKLSIKHPDCGKGALSIASPLHLAVATRGGYANWIIGRNTPSTSSGVTPVSVRVKQGGKTEKGTLSFIFAVGGTARDNMGDLTIDGCIVEFSALR